MLAGKNFGLGSSRPVASLFTELGVAGLVAEEFNSLFFRNAVNAGLPAMTVPNATAVFTEGDTGSFDLTAGTWRNETTREAGSVPKLPDLILDIIESGGVMPRLVGSSGNEAVDAIRHHALEQRRLGRDETIQRLGRYARGLRYIRHAGGGVARRLQGPRGGLDDQAQRLLVRPHLRAAPAAGADH